MVAALVRVVNEAISSIIAVSGLRVLRHMLRRDPDGMFEIYVAQRHVHMLAVGVLLAHHSSSQELALAASLLSNLATIASESANESESARTFEQSIGRLFGGGRSDVLAQLAEDPAGFMKALGGMPQAKTAARRELKNMGIQIAPRRKMVEGEAPLYATTTAKGTSVGTNDHRPFPTPPGAAEQGAKDIEVTEETRRQVRTEPKASQAAPAPPPSSPSALSSRQALDALIASSNARTSPRPERVSDSKGR